MPDFLDLKNMDTDVLTGIHQAKDHNPDLLSYDKALFYKEGPYNGPTI